MKASISTSSPSPAGHFTHPWFLHVASKSTQYSNILFPHSYWSQLLLRYHFWTRRPFLDFQISVYAACIPVTCLFVGCTTHWISLSPCTLFLVLAGVRIAILGLFPTGFLIISLSLCILGLSICHLHFCLIFLWALITSFILGLVFCIFALFSFGPLFISLVFCLRGLSVWYYVHTRC